MPKRRKGVPPTSDRHIRRLSKQKTEEELQIIESRHDKSSVENAGAIISANTLSNDETMKLDRVVLESAVTNKCDTDDVTISPNTSSNDKREQDLLCSESSQTQKTNRNESYKLDFNQISVNLNTIRLINEYEINSEYDISQNMNDDNCDDTDASDSDTDSCISSDIYRFSDSDADSIPDLDEDKIFDFDEVMQDPKNDKDKKFIEEITFWAKDCQVKQNHLKLLLGILNNYTNTTFPKDPRTLLKTPKSTNVIDMDSGQYCHMGVASIIEKIIISRCLRKDVFDVVNVAMNIDGAPIVGNSSEKGLWIISMKDIELKTVYAVGIYCGTTKPKDPNVFMKKTVDELTDFIKNGFLYNGKLYSVRLDRLILDAPAKSFILCVKGHSGYYSCTKCTIKGTYITSVCFPTDNIEELNRYCNECLRNDFEFKSLHYNDNYQHGVTILNELLYFGPVSNVPLDIMHLVYLGIMKQLIRHWMGEKGGKRKIYRLSLQNINKISARLESLKNILPFEFNRRSRSLIYWKKWKATEFRHFLLYFGAFLLKDVLHPRVYENFLTLHVYMIILHNRMLVRDKTNIEFCQSLATKFIFQFQNLYGKRNVTPNVHNLGHLCKDVEMFGTVDNFSAFSFESFICSLKKLIRKSDKPLQQIARRLSEYESVKDLKNRCALNTREFDVEKLTYGAIDISGRPNTSYYKVLKANSFQIDITDDRNNCVMITNGSIINIVSISKSNANIYITGKKCDMKRNLFVTSGLESRLLGVQVVQESDHLKEWSCNEIQAKVFKVPCTEGFIAYPLVHTFDC